MPIPGVTGSSDNRQPGTPTIGAATAGNASVSVAFTAPANTGKPNTSLTYTATTTPGPFSNTGSSSPITISGLSNGTSYTAVVKLNNTVQDSLNSAATSSFTPSAPAPFFPPFFPPSFPFFPPFFPSFQPAPTISNLAFTYNGMGYTTGTLTWTATNADVWLFTSNYPGTYPSPYNYGAFTGSWPGNLVNIDFNVVNGITSPGYTFTIEVRNNAGASASQTITVP